MHRRLPTLLFLLVAACGEPGSDTVFVQALNSDGRAAAGNRAATPRPGRRIESRPWRGLYRREGEKSQFQPCGTPEPLDVIGTAEGRALLAERFRFNAYWQGLPMFGVLRGNIVMDTLVRAGRSVSDTARVEIVTRFFVTGVDSLRTWDNECPGMRGGR